MRRGYMRDTIDEKATEFELPEGYPRHIPHFATQEEAGDFWDTHSTAPYFYEGEDVTNNPPPELSAGSDAIPRTCASCVRRPRA